MTYDYTDPQFDPEAEATARARDELYRLALAAGREAVLNFRVFALLSKSFLDEDQQQHLDEARKRIEWALGIVRRAR